MPRAIRQNVPVLLRHFSSYILPILVFGLSLYTAINLRDVTVIVNGQRDLLQREVSDLKARILRLQELIDRLSKLPQYNGEDSKE
jgi:hypothetical protein